MRRINLLFLTLATLLLLTTLSATVLISGHINWEIGQVFGAPEEFAWGVNSGDMLGGFLVTIGVCQIVWVPFFYLSHQEGSKLGMWFSGLMAIFSLFVSITAGVAWQYAHEDLGARKSQGQMSDWNADIKTITSNNKLAFTKRRPKEIQADINALLNSTVTVRGRIRNVNALTKGCTKLRLAARGTCTKVRELKRELAQSEASIERTKESLAARERRDANLTVDMAKYYEIFTALFGVKKEDLKIGRITALQILMELCSNVIPFFLVWLWFPGDRLPTTKKKTRRDVPRETPRRAGFSPQIIQGGLDKKEVLARYVSETDPRGAQIPKEFLAALNAWCEAHGFRRFQTRDVSRYVEPLGGYKCTEYKNSSARIRWVFKKEMAA